MAQKYEFLLARADEAASEAQGAALDNVKQRALRSEKAWRAMAERTRKIEQEREKTLLKKETESAESV